LHCVDGSALAFRDLMAFYAARGGAGKQWTTAKREAGQGKRKPVQGDPLPQT
jgi:hypothetical protein